MDLSIYFHCFMLALTVSLITVPFLRRWALDRGTVDVPDARKVHNIPTPRLGGIAIFLAFLCSVLIFAPNSETLRGVLAGGLVVFITGIIDDLRGLTSKQKFIGQIVACLVTIMVGDLWLHDLGNLFGFGRIVLPMWLGVMFTTFAVVGVTNAINLIDGLDGLAGGISVLTLVAFGLLGLLDGNTHVPLLAAALAGAVLGFLKYNFYPARIFMGDTGSLTVGFFLGFFAVHLTQRTGAAVSPMLPVLVLGLPLFDAVWVMGRRLYGRMSPFAPDKTHVHHMFLNIGFEHRFTVLVIYSISFFWACSALLLGGYSEYQLLSFLFLSAGFFYLMLHHVLPRLNRYLLLLRDRIAGIRESESFNRIATHFDRLSGLLVPLLALYGLLGLWFVLMDGNNNWPVASLLLAVGLCLVLLARNNREFQLLIVYAAACLVAFVVWKKGDVVLAGVSAHRIADLLLFVAVGVLGIMMFFRRNGEFSLNCPDFLVLTLMVFLLVATWHPKLFDLHLNGLLLHAILLTLAVRAVASRSTGSHRLLVNATLALLAIFALSGLHG